MLCLCHLVVTVLGIAMFWRESLEDVVCKRINC